jgi:hypothetical protein
MSRSPRALLGLGLGLVVLGLFGAVRHRGGSGPGGFLVVESPTAERIGSGELTFTLRNPGTAPVTIRGVNTGCGCADPRVEPRIVEPGGECVLTVRVTAPSTGSRRVPITLDCDSRRTPSIALMVNARSAVAPPYISRVSSDLILRSGGAVARDLTVETIEPDREATPPVVRNEVEGVTVRGPAVSESRVGMAVGAVARSYQYQVEFSEATAKTGLSGLLVVADPWGKGQQFPIVVHRDPMPPIRVLPAPVELRRSRDESEAPGRRVIVMTSDPGAAVVAELRAAEPGRLELTDLSRPRDGVPWVFSVALRGAPPRGEPMGAVLAVRLRDDPESEVRVPVHYEPEARP